MKIKRFPLLIVSSVLLWGVFSCTSLEKTSDTAGQLYKEAEEEFQSGHYIAALEKYKEFKSQYPYSPQAIDAELRIADTYFAQESFQEAESAYEIFKELHPTHSKVDYVQFQIAMSNYEQIPGSSSRDLGAARKAIDAFDVLKASFPESEYAKKADELIINTKKKIAEYENTVADMYFTKQHYLAASYRYNVILSQYPKMGYDEEALFRLGLCYYNIRNNQGAIDTLSKFLSEFPQSSNKAKAQELLNEVSKK